MNNTEVAKSAPGGAVKVREDLAGQEITVGGDLMPAAAAAAERADIEARTAVAKKCPRDEDQSWQDIRKDCQRPSYAGIALYNKPVGKERDPQTGEWKMKYVTNISIRGIEGMLQRFGNVYVSSKIVYDDPKRLLLRVQVLDLERNIGYAQDALIDKTVERKDVKKGRTVLGVRENTWGDPVYLVEATSDEFRNKMGAERSKLYRDNGQRLLPSDWLHEARQLIDATLANETAKDPDAAKKKVLDRFITLGISAKMLKEYLDVPIETLTAQGLADLGILFNGLKEGQFTWADVMRSKEAPAEGETEDVPAGASSAAPAASTRKRARNVLAQQQASDVLAQQQATFEPEPPKETSNG